MDLGSVGVDRPHNITRHLALGHWLAPLTAVERGGRWCESTADHHKLLTRSSTSHLLVRLRLKVSAAGASSRAV